MPAAVQRVDVRRGLRDQRVGVDREQGRLAAGPVERGPQHLLGFAARGQELCRRRAGAARSFRGRPSAAAARRLPRAHRYSSSAVGSPSSAGRWRDEASAEAKPLLDAAATVARLAASGVGCPRQRIAPVVCVQVVVRAIVSVLAPACGRACSRRFGRACRSASACGRRRVQVLDCLRRRGGRRPAPPGRGGAHATRSASPARSRRRPGSADSSASRSKPAGSLSSVRRPADGSVSVST